MAQNLYFTKLYNIPEMINHVDPAKNPQSTLVIFGNLLPKRPIFGFWAIILEPHQINPKFLHFLNALRCPDLGQEESQKVGSTLVIKFVVCYGAFVLTLQLNEILSANIPKYLRRRLRIRQQI